MEHQIYVTQDEALRLGGAGAPDIEGYKRLLAGLGDGTALRVALGGEVPRAAQESNFRRAAAELGVEVAFSQLREDDNVPYLLVTRNPSTLKPHIP